MKNLQKLIRESISFLLEDVSNFTQEKETEKAIQVSIPYWTPTGESEKKHNQKKLTLWVPKSVVKDGKIPMWVLEKAFQDMKSKNRYLDIEAIKKHLGEIAPEKKLEIKTIPDAAAQQQAHRDWENSLPPEYKNERNAIDQYYFISPPDDKSDAELQAEFKARKEAIANMTTQIKLYK